MNLGQPLSLVCINMCIHSIEFNSVLLWMRVGGGLAKCRPVAPPFPEIACSESHSIDATHPCA